MPSLLGRCGGGGSFAPLQGFYNAPNQSVPSGGSFGDAAWAYLFNDAVLDLTNPAQPAVIATGLYIFTIAFSISGGGVAGRTFQGNIQLDTVPSRNMVSEVTNPSGGFGITGHNSDAVVMTAGETLRFRLVNNDSFAHNMNMQEAHVVFIPTA
jgi:hypothetical protein